ncbi:MAG: NAD(P)-dependent glycerol-3-phosphate dehydrogenase [Chloroflexi bacterium]|nr:NAD(P)-dependent glycerol-3-phosphate dehydrogenase [Chloroflexota bacterium]
MPDTFAQAAVVGVTAWGTTLAVHLARRGAPTLLVARTEAEAEALRRDRRSPRLAGVVFPEQLAVATAESLSAADLVCFAVPSHTLAANAAQVRSVLHADATILSATKGIDRETGRRMSEILGEALPGHPLAVISGPNLSREVIEGLPGSTVIATRDASVTALRAAFHSRALRVYTSEDIAGVEFGGALKNVIAIAGGMVDGFQFGNNAKAALLTRGLAEITRLGVAGGAQTMTFQGLAGIGDLIATSYSPLSRNRRLGELIAGGATLQDSLARLGETAEGATTIPAALRLAARLGVEMPITSALERVLYQGAHPLEEVRALREREPRSEH